VNTPSPNKVRTKPQNEDTEENKDVFYDASENFDGIPRSLKPPSLMRDFMAPVPATISDYRKPKRLIEQ
jgi:hypothetical protein